MWLGPTASVLILDPEHIREIMQKINLFQKRRGNPLSRLLVEGLASYEGDKRAKHRNLNNPAFPMGKLKHMLPSFYTSATEILSKWEKIVSTKGSSELDVWPDLRTSHAISRRIWQ
ncbi:hypothetical protein ACH5RR_037249 [Cinchona calisaya]|uniref:Uncharacterized protein n=1 Tax=Cinchona calisaya TaxID=153742 RepID=A0ABD2Y9C6_9GENT